MKNIIKFFALALAAATLAVSCDLSEYNPNKPGYEQVFGSVENVQYVINDFYGAFGSVTSAYSGDTGTDIFPASQLAARFRSTYDATTPGDSWGEWDDVYALNYTLERLNSSAASSLDASVRNDFKAQVKLFRANKYFGMLQTYGDLPWIDRVISPTETEYEHKDRDSRDVIIKHIIDDLDDAIDGITSTSPDGTCVSKEVALFVKMQVCLYEASFRKYNDVTTSAKGAKFSNYSVEELYRLAADAAKQIMETGKYELIPNYRDLFLSEKLQTKEVILGAQTAANVKGSQNYYFAYRGIGEPRSFTRNFINTFLMKDGTPYTNKSGYATDSWKDEFTNRDPRLDSIVRYPGYHYNYAKSIPDFECSKLGYQVRKCVYDHPAETSGADPDEKQNANLNSSPLMRYAEVLLDYAEAKAELGEMDNSIWTQTIGAIRKRAGITGSTLTTVPTTVDNYLKTNFYPNVTDAAIMEIRRERAIELCLEGRRTDDLIRWGCGKQLASAPWTGINIDAINTPIDLDGDGTNDICFYTTAAGKSAGETAGVTTIDVSGTSGVTCIANGSKYQLNYPVSSTLRYWAADNHFILEAIPSEVIAEYEAVGYTLTQNPGY